MRQIRIDARAAVTWLACCALSATAARAQETTTGETTQETTTGETTQETTTGQTSPATTAEAPATSSDVSVEASAETALGSNEDTVDERNDVEAPSPPRDDEFGIRGTAEVGFTGVLAHEITLGQTGTRIDYVNDLAQNNLYLFVRLQVDVDIWRQHILTLLYQPLDITSTTTAPRDLTIDGELFPAGQPIQARYGFPFYRFGWAFDVLEGRDEELAFGVGLQLRNATIEFRSLDGTRFRTRTDVGPVPLLRARGRFPIGAGWFFAFEADGWWSPIPGLNGSSNNLVEGAIADLSVRLGWRLVPHVDAFLNVRYLGGGADGVSDPTPTSDGFQANWLHFLSVSVGATIDSRE